MSGTEPCDCERFGRQVEELLDRELDDLDARLLREHAQQCPDCANRETAEIHLRQLIRQCLQAPRVQASRQLRARIMVSIHRETVVRLRTSDEVCD